MIRVLVVEDSPVVREFLVLALSSDPDVEVVGTAGDGVAALAAVRRHRPDVVTMDIHMPRMDGLVATRRLMEEDPVPIVIVSGSSETNEVATTFAALEAGALAMVARPAGFGNPLHEATTREMIRTVKLMSEVRVVRRRTRPVAASPAHADRPDGPSAAPLVPAIVAMGASTGGPPVLHTILAGLPETFPVPVVVVQHMAAGFTHGFAAWLDQHSALSVGVATQGQSLRGGHVYLAPDDRHLQVTPARTFALCSEPPEHGLRPSVASLFRSLGEAYGSAAVAGLLSGMGRDGALELRRLRDLGATTFVQDRASAVVHGMAGHALELEAAMMILPPDRIAGMLISLTERSRPRCAR